MTVLDDIYPQPEPIQVQPPKQKGVMNVEVIGKTKIALKAVQYSLVLIGLAHVGFSAWAVMAPDATVYRNLKGMASTDRAYIKQILTNCGSQNYFADNSDSCEISRSALATLFKGQAVIANIDRDTLPASNNNHSQWEQQAQAAETPAGNEQSPSSH